MNGYNDGEPIFSVRYLVFDPQKKQELTCIEQVVTLKYRVHVTFDDNDSKL